MLEILISRCQKSREVLELESFLYFLLMKKCSELENRFGLITGTSLSLKLTRTSRVNPGLFSFDIRKSVNNV